MGLFKSKAYITGKGSSVTLVDSGWDAEWTSYSLSNEEREALDVTHTRSPDGYMEFRPGGFINAGTLEVTFKYDPSTPPPIDGDAEMIQLELVKGDSTDRIVIGGLGFLTSAGGADIPEGAGLATSTATIQKSGKWSVIEAEPIEVV